MSPFSLYSPLISWSHIWQLLILVLFFGQLTLQFIFWGIIMYIWLRSQLVVYVFYPNMVPNFVQHVFFAMFWWWHCIKSFYPDLVTVNHVSGSNNRWSIVFWCDISVYCLHYWALFPGDNPFETPIASMNCTQPQGCIHIEDKVKHSQSSKNSLTH